MHNVLEISTFYRHTVLILLHKPQITMCVEFVPRKILPVGSTWQCLVVSAIRIVQVGIEVKKAYIHDIIHSL